MKVCTLGRLFCLVGLHVKFSPDSAVKLMCPPVQCCALEGMGGSVSFVLFARDYEWGGDAWLSKLMHRSRHLPFC